MIMIGQFKNSKTNSYFACLDVWTAQGWGNPHVISLQAGIYIVIVLF